MTSHIVLRATSKVDFIRIDDHPGVLKRKQTKILPSKTVMPVQVRACLRNV